MFGKLRDVAVILQWAFERTGILSPMLVGTNLIFGGMLLLAAGAYQLTPIKHACLRRCRSPLAFLGTHWRRDACLIAVSLAAQRHIFKKLLSQYFYWITPGIGPFKR